MKIQELEKKLFGNTPIDKKIINKILSDGGFDFDKLSEPNEFGDQIPLVKVKGEDYIPLEDIIVLDEEEFKEIHTKEEELLTYKNYRRKYIILGREESLKYFRNRILEEKRRLEAFNDLTIGDIQCGGF